jgi:hypothetical protein
VYCASPSAIAAATAGYLKGARRLADPAGLTDALVAAHDPALGLERSVCLRDVYDEIRISGRQLDGVNLAEWLKRRFAR